MPYQKFILPEEIGLPRKFIFTERNNARRKGEIQYFNDFLPKNHTMIDSADLTYWIVDQDSLNYWTIQDLKDLLKEGIIIGF
jgi:hypothetical protein